MFQAPYLLNQTRTNTLLENEKYPCDEHHSNEIPPECMEDDCNRNWLDATATGRKKRIPYQYYKTRTQTQFRASKTFSSTQSGNGQILLHGQTVKDYLYSYIERTLELLRSITT